MLSVVTAITGLLGTIGTSWIEKRKIKAEGKIKIESAKIEAKVRKVDNLHTLDQKSVSDMRFSWKDEFWTIILSIPAIGCFIPGGAEIMVEGFKALELMPEFYQYWLGVAVLTAFGIRIVKR